MIFGVRKPKKTKLELQLANVQEAHGIVTWVWDTSSENVDWFGDPAPMLGLKPGKFKGTLADYLACLNPDDVAAARATFIDCLKGKTPVYRTEERVLHPDGSIRWLET